MAALQFADLLKELKGTTIPRWTVLVNKIKTKDTFVIDKTTQEVKLNYLDKNIQGLFEQVKLQIFKPHIEVKNYLKLVMVEN